VPHSQVTARQQENVSILDFSRDLDTSSYEGAFRAYNEAMRGKVTALALNFSHTDYINSTGVALLITLVETAVDAKCTVYAVGLNKHYQHMFGMVGLSEKLIIVANEAELFSNSKNTP